MRFNRTIALRAVILMSLPILVASCAGHTGASPSLPVVTPAPTAIPPGPAPDYSQSSAWLALPPSKETLDGVPADGGFSDLESSSAVDVFYIYPTTSFEGDNPSAPSGYPNATYDDPLADGLAYEIGANQAGTFNGQGRIFAPYYRQATMNVWFNDTAQQAQPAAELAYADVKAAFDYYIAYYNHGRPIILVGHSQGAEIGMRLLKDEFDGKWLNHQLVAAYLPGQGISNSTIASFSQVHPCANATDTGCFNNWESFQSGIATQSMLDFIGGSPYWEGGNTNYSVPTIPVFPSMNTVTWSTAAATAPASADPGALDMLIPYPPLYSPGGIPYPMGHLSTTQFSVQTYGATGTPLAIGTFVSPSPPASEFAAYVPGIIPIDADFGGVWHLYDFNLYWTDIRQNARDRTNAYFLSQGSHLPFISGPVAATVAAGQPLTYRVTTTSPATQFSATGLNGLGIDTVTGTITGTPSVQAYAIVITATNASGSATGELALTAQ